MSPDLLKHLIQRRNDLRHWLDREAPETGTEQRHLNACSVEQAYWHHGYQSALDDVLALLTNLDADYSAGKTSH